MMSGMSAIAAACAFGNRPVSAQTAAAPFQPARHPQDEWLDKVPGKHRVVIDATSAKGVPEAIHFAYNIYSGNKSAYGLEEAALGVVIILRHAATAFGYSDAMWAKYGTSFAEAARYADPKSSESPKVNPFYASPRESIDALAKRGVQFGVCETASRGLSRRIAGAGGDADAAFKEIAASMIPSSRLVVAGVIGVTRAQEYGYSVLHVG